MSRFSVAIIARDAETTIGKTLSSALSVSDDVVVVLDPRSVDQTAKVIDQFPVRRFSHSFQDFSSQKNFAATLTKNSWVLSLDADESLSIELASELKKMPVNSHIHAYNLKRKNRIFGKIINHTNWDPDGLIRLYNREYCHWTGEVHETLHVPGEIGFITKGFILHENYSTVEDFMARQDRYSTYTAHELYKSGRRFNLLNLFISPAVEFVRRYIVHIGFMDGTHGLFLSMLMAIYQLMVHTKLWQLQHTPDVSQ